MRIPLLDLVSRWWRGDRSGHIDECAVVDLLRHYSDRILLDGAEVTGKAVVCVFHPREDKDLRGSREVTAFLGKNKTERAMTIGDVSESVLQALRLSIHTAAGIPLTKRLEHRERSGQWGPSFDAAQASNVGRGDRLTITVSLDRIKVAHSVTALSKDGSYPIEDVFVEEATACMGKATLIAVHDAHFKVVDAPGEADNHHTA